MSTEGTDRRPRNAGLWVHTVSNPSHPMYLQSLTPGGQATCMWYSDSQLKMQLFNWQVLRCHIFAPNDHDYWKYPAGDCEVGPHKYCPLCGIRAAWDCKCKSWMCLNGNCNWHLTPVPLTPAEKVAYLEKALEELGNTALALAHDAAESRADVDHASAEAKRRQPDFPFTQGTASEAVWALGESLLGTEAANKDWQELARKQEDQITELKKLLTRYKEVGSVLSVDQVGNSLEAVEAAMALTELGAEASSAINKPSSLEEARRGPRQTKAIRSDSAA